jgi:hypothetical protein
MENTVRVYLWIGGSRRTLCWISIGRDESIYWSSSNSGGFRRGFTQENVAIPIGGARITPAVDGRPMSQEEIAGYHSLHASGISLLPTRTGGKRTRHRTLPISTYPGPIPLFSLMPMEVTRYPVAWREAKSQDLVLDCNPFLAQPFALMFYAKRPKQPHPPSTNQHEDWDIYSRYSSCLGALEICAVAYANLKTFTRWPELEIEATSRADGDTQELRWIVFGTT